MKPVSPLAYSLRLLKVRLRSRSELEQAMKRKGFLEQERTEVLDKLERVDLVNDTRFAKSWISSRDRLAPRGASLLKMELTQKGISKDIIEQALFERQSNDDVPDEFLQAKILVERRERQYVGLTREVRERRLTSFLLRRGFSYGVIKRILDS